MVRAEESNRPVIRISGIVIAAAFAVLPVAVPINAEGDGIVTNDPTMHVQNGALNFYDGDWNGVAWHTEEVHASDIASPTQAWDITDLQPVGGIDDIPIERGVFILAHVTDDPDAIFPGLVGGVPQRGVNYDIVHVARIAGAMATYHLTFSLPPFGDPSAPSGAYELYFVEEPENYYTWDDSLEQSVAHPYTDDDLAAWLARPDLEGAEINPTYGPASFSRQILIDYVADGPKKCTEQCYSNVVFIPGIESSRLYDGDGHQIWEPYTAADDEALRMDANGNSVRDDIYTKDIIDSGYHIADIYGGFEAYMNGLVADHTIVAWKALPYDWRQDLETTATQPIALGDGNSYTMVQAIEQLASTSPSGKVTIVAHSMGGLVGKLLISALAAKGEANLVDKFIMVGTPQVGTPVAVAAMLHGESLGMPTPSFPLFLAKSDARDLGATTPSAYMLLPSAAYFNLVSSTPMVMFDDGSATALFRAAYGESITSFSNLEKFLLGSEGRTQPAKPDLQNPSILSSSLLARAQTEQDELAAWTAPPGIAVTQIAGWGLDTVSGIDYVTEKKWRCGETAGRITCGTYDQLDYRPVFSDKGDNTVVSQSATFMAEPSLYINLPTYNFVNNLSDGHSNLFSISPVQQLLGNLIENSSALPQYVVNLPSATESKFIRIQIHSPLDISITDANGNHLGIASTTGTLDEQIPGSYYMTFGEGKYLGIPADGTYHVAVQGSGEGTFTMQIDDVEGGVVATSTIYEDVPVSPGLAGSFTLMDGSSSPLSLDTDGDGKTDVQLDNAGTLSFEDYAALFMDTVQQSSIQKVTQKGLLTQMQALEKSEKQFEKQSQKEQKLLKAPKAKGVIGQLINQILGKSLGSILTTGTKIRDAALEAQLKTLQNQITQLTEQGKIDADDGMKLLQTITQMEDLV